MGKIQEFRDKVHSTNKVLTEKELWRCLGCEFIGTFLLVFIGCGSTMQVDGGEKPTLVGVSLCFGLIVATLVETIGHISCHINPAVTLAMFVCGKIPLFKALFYIVIQCLGGIVGIGALKAFTPDLIKEPTFGYTELGKGVTPLQGFGVEFLLTFVLLLIIFAMTDENRVDIKGSGPVAIGLALTGLVIYGGPLTGAGMNPARVLGPCLILGRFENHWIYWLGPLGGAVTAAALYKYAFRALGPNEIVSDTILTSFDAVGSKVEKLEKQNNTKSDVLPV